MHPVRQGKVRCRQLLRDGVATRFSFGEDLPDGHQEHAGDGNRVKSTIGGVTTAYVGNYFEWKTSTSDMVKYYYAGTTRVAMRTGGSTVNYLLGDHLGSMAITTDSLGANPAEIRYMPWGTTRYTSGTPPTTYRFTGQRLESSLGLYFYNTRWYDPAAGRFIQADTIIPSGVQGLDRYAYVNNNPIIYVDPSGHETVLCDEECENEDDRKGILSLDEMAALYGIIFTGDWSLVNKADVLVAVDRVGDKFTESVGGTASSAFRSVYGLNDGKMFQFEWDPNCWGCRTDPVGCDAGTTTGDACIPAFGYTVSENHIEFASISPRSDLRRINNVIHELGHAFNRRLNRAPEDALSIDLLTRPEGFYGKPGNYTWVQSPYVTPSEIFADQFIGWIYGLWANDELGPKRADSMNKMNGNAGWVSQSAALP